MLIRKPWQEKSALGGLIRVLSRTDIRESQHEKVALGELIDLFSQTIILEP